MLVKYIGNATAYYNDRSYQPGEVYETADEIPLRDRKGRPLENPDGTIKTTPLILTPYSKLRHATEEEAEEYYRTHPRAARRIENAELAKREEVKRGRKTSGGRAANPLKADGVVN